MSRRKFLMHGEQWPRRAELARMYLRILSLDLVSDLGLQGNDAQRAVVFEEKLTTFSETLTQYVAEVRMFHEKLEAMTEERVAALWCRVLEQCGLDAVRKATGRRAVTRPAGGRPARGRQHDVPLRHATEVLPEIQEQE